MITIKIEHVTVQVVEQGKLDEILAYLLSMQKTLKEIKTMDQATQDLLIKVDATTNKIASNITVIANVDQQISDEMDALIAKIGSGATPADVTAALQGLADRLQASSDASDAQVAVLQGIAAKGAPVVPEPPPAPVLPA